MWPNPHMVAAYLSELVRDKAKNKTSLAPQGMLLFRVDDAGVFITRAPDNMVHYDDTTDEEPYLENKQATYEHMGLEREDERQVIIDRSAGPGGTRSVSQPPVKYPPSPSRLVPPKRAQKQPKKSTTPLKKMAASNSTLSKTQSRRVQQKTSPMYLKTQSEVESKSTMVPNLKSHSQQMKPQRSAVTMRTESKRSLANSQLTKSSRLAGTRSSVKRTSINSLKAEDKSPLRYSPKPAASASSSKLPAIGSKPNLASSKKSIKKAVESDDEKIVFKEEPNTPDRPTVQTPHPPPSVPNKIEEVKQSKSSIKVVEEVKEEVHYQPKQQVEAPVAAAPPPSKSPQVVPKEQPAPPEEPEYDEFDFEEPSMDKPAQSIAQTKEEIVEKKMEKVESKPKVEAKKEEKQEDTKEEKKEEEKKVEEEDEEIRWKKESVEEEQEDYEEDDYQQDEFDMQSPAGDEYKKFTFEQPYSKPGKKHQDQQLAQRVEEPKEVQKREEKKSKEPAEEEQEEEDYEDQDFEGDMSKEKQPEELKETEQEPQEQEQDDQDDEGELAKSTSTPQITAAGVPAPDGGEAQLASDSDEENDTQIEITKAFEMDLPLEKLCNKKINYFNNDTQENVFQLHSSHPEFMGLKDNEVKIGAQQQGKFQLRFQPVDEPAEQQYVLFVLKNGQPWENILFSVSYKP